MPIGKNAIKRVSNSGYSNVQSSAPDMENSMVAEVKAEEAPKVEAPIVVAKKATAKEAQRKTAKKTATAKKTTRSVKSSQKQVIEHIAIGDDMPYYLL